MRVPLLAVLMSGAIGCTTTPDDISEVRATISRLIRADNASDLDIVMSCYTQDAIFLPPNDAPTIGLAAIMMRYESLFDRFKPELVCESFETLVGRDFAIDCGVTHGRLVPRDGSEPREINDKYLMVLRRDESGDGWLISRLIWNQNRALP